MFDIIVNLSCKLVLFLYGSSKPAVFFSKYKDMYLTNLLDSISASPNNNEKTRILTYLDTKSAFVILLCKSFYISSFLSNEPLQRNRVDLVLITLHMLPKAQK